MDFLNSSILKDHFNNSGLNKRINFRDKHPQITKFSEMSVAFRKSIDSQTQNEKHQNLLDSDERLKKLYDNMMKYDGYYNISTSLSNCVMRGYLKKHVNQFKLFQRKKYYKRFYDLDFNTGQLTIKHSLNDSEHDPNNQFITMGEIQECSIIIFGSEEAEQLAIITSSTYRFPFKIKFSGREMILCA